MSVIGRRHAYGMCVAVCRVNLQKEALLLNFIGQLLMLVNIISHMNFKYFIKLLCLV